MLVRDRMSSPAVTITPDTTLRDALELMHEHQFRRLPVVNDQDELIGIVSERDLLYASPPPASLRGAQEPSDVQPALCVGDIMTQDVMVAPLGGFVDDVARLMADNKIGGLPVVDEEGHVTGVITETDVFRAFIEMYSAGHSGLYVTLEAPDRKGMVAELSRAVFDWGGNVVSVSSFYDERRGEHKLIIKGHDIEKDRVVGVLESFGLRVTEALQVRVE